MESYPNVSTESSVPWRECSGMSHSESEEIGTHDRASPVPQVRGPQGCRTTEEGQQYLSF